MMNSFSEDAYNVNQCLFLGENALNLIEERVAQANAGLNPYVVTRLKSGWVVMGDVQPLEGYCGITPI